MDLQTNRNLTTNKNFFCLTFYDCIKKPHDNNFLLNRGNNFKWDKRNNCYAKLDEALNKSVVFSSRTADHVVFMYVSFPRINLASVVNLQFFCSRPFHVLTSQESRAKQVPMLCLDLLNCISHLDHSRYRSSHLSSDVKQCSIRINFDYELVHWGCALVAHVASHSAALKNLTGVLTHTDRTWSSVGQTHTVGSILHTKIPPLNRSLESLTFANWNSVYELTDLEVTRTETIANWQ